MKKHVGVVALICLCIILQTSSAFAENETEYIIPEAVLNQSADKSEIESLTPEIVESANLFEEENVHATEADIDFSSAYCVFVDADIFAKRR